MDYAYSYNSKKKANVYCIGNKNIDLTQGPPGPQGPQGPPGESASVYGQISYNSGLYSDVNFDNPPSPNIIEVTNNVIRPFTITTNLTNYYIDDDVKAYITKTDITYNNTNNVFGIKYTGTQEKKLRVLASFDCQTDKNKRKMGIYIGKISENTANITDVALGDIQFNYENATDYIYYKGTECGATAESSNQIAKLISSWIFKLQPNQSIIIGLTSYTSGGGNQSTNKVFIYRGRIIVSEI